MQVHSANSPLRILSSAPVTAARGVKGFNVGDVSEPGSLTTFAANVSSAYSAQRITKIAAREAMAFTLAGAVAERLRCGVAMLTKSEPSDIRQYDSKSFVDYSGTPKNLYLLADSQSGRRGTGDR